jgi:hypothetical protein
MKIRVRVDHPYSGKKGAERMPWPASYFDFDAVSLIQSTLSGGTAKLYGRTWNPESGRYENKGRTSVE